MSIISRPSVVGALVAITLMLGAAASPHSSVSPSTPSNAVWNVAQWTYLTALARSCRDQLLDDALDAYGEGVARLKQI